MHKIITHRRKRKCDAINLRGMTHKHATLLIDDDSIFEVTKDERSEFPVAKLLRGESGWVRYTQLAKEADRTIMQITRYTMATSSSGMVTLYYPSGDTQSMQLPK